MGRILFLVHRVPYPPDKGDKIRSWQILLAMRGCGEVTVACFVDDPADWPHVESLRRECKDVIAVGLGRRVAKLRSLVAIAGAKPLSLAYYRSATMRRRLAEDAARGAYDAVVVFSSTMAMYADGIEAPRRILDLCDLDSEKWGLFAERARFPMSWIYRTEARRLGAYEVEAANRFDATTLVSDAEAQVLRGRAPEADVRVVPNGVDLEYLDPDLTSAKGDGRTIVFCGYMDYRSNVDAACHFAEEVLPLVRRELPDARFRIIGANPAPRIRRLAESPGIEVTGRVADVRPEILAGDVSIAPMRLGRGVPNKILEALALGLPVVASNNGVAGLPLAGFTGVDVADEPAPFAQAVLHHLRNAQAGNGSHPGNRERLQERFSWNTLRSKFRGLLGVESGEQRE